jgi:uncharacterized protein involved in outer membrane biogenesis
MKTALKLVGILLVVVVAGLVGLTWYLNRYVQSPAFQQQVRQLARQNLQIEVEIGRIEFSLLRGVTLRNIAIANPAGFDGNLFTAEGLVLRYELMPLLRRQFQVEKLRVEQPVIRLMRNEQSVWNYEQLGASGEGRATDRPGQQTGAGRADGARRPAFDLALSEFGVINGELLMLRADGGVLARLSGMTLDSSVNVAGGVVSGGGRAGIQTIHLAESISIRNAAGPLTISNEEIVLSPLAGSLAGGTASGTVKLIVRDGARYNLDLQVAQADVSQLLREAGARALMSGKLAGEAQLSGTGGLPTVSGAGNAEVLNGRLASVPVLDLLAAVLMIPELAGIEFTECRVEFTIADNVMQTPVVRLTAPRLNITGQGSVSLEDYSLRHDLTLAMEAEMVPREIRRVFTPREDGYLGLDFKVWGPYDKPKTDIKERLVKGAVETLIDEGLKKLFR